MKNRSLILGAILSVLACVAVSPQMRAAPQVVPAPDGCYPGFTTAEGCNALAALTSGAGNTGLGWYALFSAGAANFNTAVGGGALALNTGDDNTAVGAVALLLNTTGTENTAVGTDALVSNTIGMQNTATGSAALEHNTTGNENTADGRAALDENDTGNGNTAIGFQALFHSTGSDNIALGDGAGINLNMGSHNIYIGNLGVATTESDTIRIGTSLVQEATYIAGIYGSPPGANTLPVVCADDGKLTANASSRRFKHDIKQMDSASEGILALKPVSFRYNNDSTNTPWFGLIAEDVAEVNPDLIARDKEGKPFGVRYDQVNVMLLNEFLKEHHKVQELEANAARQQKQIEALTAGLQKVSAQLELSKPTPQTVLNNQ
jgi:hypothetical protein